jgi:glycosyltransferase involved in cell wall biosynthesis
MVAGPLLALWSRANWPAAEWWTGPVDVVHGTNFVVPPARRGAEVVTVHDLTALRFPELCSPVALGYPHLVRRAIARGAWIHTPSQFVAREVVELLGADPERVVAVAHGVDPAPAEPTPVDGSPAEDNRTILALATSEPRKDLPTLVAAFDRVAATHDDVRLVLAGPDGWGAAVLAAAIAGARFGRRIQRLGWVDPARKAALLRSASVFAYPSRYEGFGLPPLEAMAAGVPVVASDAGAVAEAVGDAACLVPVGDADAMAAALLALLGEGDLRRRLIDRGRQRAATFTWSRCAAGLVELYRRAASP